MTLGATLRIHAPQISLTVCESGYIGTALLLLIVERHLALSRTRMWTIEDHEILGLLWIGLGKGPGNYTAPVMTDDGGALNIQIIHYRQYVAGQMR